MFRADTPYTSTSASNAEYAPNLPQARERATGAFHRHWGRGRRAFLELKQPPSSGLPPPLPAQAGSSAGPASSLSPLCARSRRRCWTPDGDFRGVAPDLHEILAVRTVAAPVARKPPTPSAP